MPEFSVQGNERHTLHDFMNGKDFSEVVDLIVKEDPRFDKGAYFFVRKALDHTLKNINDEVEPRENNHVSGRELLEGIRDFALDQYGPMSFTVFNHWGVRQSSDFGDIVFNLVDYGVFGKTEHDNRADFKDGFDFREAFLEPFLPEKRKREPGQGNGKQQPDLSGN